MGVWAGNNDNSPMVNVTGVDGAGPIWHDSLLLAEQGHPITDFTNPGGVVKRTVHYPGHYDNRLVSGGSACWELVYIIWQRVRVLMN